MSSMTSSAVSIQTSPESVPSTPSWLGEVAVVAHYLTHLGLLEKIVEWGGDQTPDGIQRLLSKAKWDADLVRNDLQCYVMEHLADRQAILIVDETGFPKQGDKDAGSCLSNSHTGPDSISRSS